MATIKKPVKKAAAKKPAVKKPAAKKPAVKKTAAKKTAVNKPRTKGTAAKKAAVKKPVVKKAAVNKPRTKGTAAKKPAVKKPRTTGTAVKKPAVKKPAAKKPVIKKTAEKKPAAKKPSPAVIAPAPIAKKPAPKPVKPEKAQKPAADADSVVKSRNLFDAFAMGKLPFNNGYIVSSFFNETSAYSIYEIVSYAGVKEIFLTEQGLQFITGGKKLFVLVEPASYHNKPVEPVHRTQGESIPKRFSELEIITAVANQTKIMVSKEADEIYGSFTILKPTSINFSVVFYQLPDVYETLAKFFEESLNRQRKVPQTDAKKAALLIATTIQKQMGFQGEYE